MISEFFVKIENWIDDESFFLTMFKFCFILAIIGGAVIAPFVIMANKESETEYRKCLDSGRGWAIVGSHQTTNMVWVGKVLIPQTHTVTDYGCLEVKR